MFVYVKPIHRIGLAKKEIHDEKGAEYHENKTSEGPGDFKWVVGTEAGIYRPQAYS